jgi:hypothetical protein
MNEPIVNENKPVSATELDRAYFIALTAVAWVLNPAAAVYFFPYYRSHDRLFKLVELVSIDLVLYVAYHRGRANGARNHQLLFWALFAILVGILP